MAASALIKAEPENRPVGTSGWVLSHTEAAISRRYATEPDDKSAFRPGAEGALALSTKPLSAMAELGIFFLRTKR